MRVRVRAKCVPVDTTRLLRLATRARWRTKEEGKKMKDLGEKEREDETRREEAEGRPARTRSPIYWSLRNAAGFQSPARSRFSLVDSPRAKSGVSLTYLGA